MRIQNLYLVTLENNINQYLLHYPRVNPDLKGIWVIPGTGGVIFNEKENPIKSYTLCAAFCHVR